MRKKNQEITDIKILDEILSTGLICRIAMADRDAPYLLPFNYGYRDRCIYIHSAPEGKKIDLLGKNNRICFEVEGEMEIIKGDTPCKWTSFYRSVVGYGEVEIVTDPLEKQKGLEIIMTQHGATGDMKFERSQVDAMVILKIPIERMSGKQSGNWNRISEKKRKNET